MQLVGRNTAPKQGTTQGKHSPTQPPTTEQRAAQLDIGALALDVMPAYVSDRQAGDACLARLANDIGITTAEILACRRYALSGDVRAMDGW